MGIYEVCEQAIGLVRGKRLILNAEERTALENLDYERLTSLHAQDEAVICVLHFERVRDRLLQIYPWTFARKTTAITGGILPSDCLTLLCVEQDGIPVEYEQTGDKVNITGSITVHYTSRVTEVSSWSAIFTDVFCYSLAVEICSAVTGKPEYVQLLEQKVQELIHRAYRIGAIREETKLPLKEELYERAKSLVYGQRTIKGSSDVSVTQGLDNAGELNGRELRANEICRKSSESIRDRLLQLYAWEFAKRSVMPESTETISGWSNGYVLPSDCLKVLTVLKDGEAIDWEVSNGKVYCNGENITLRYTARHNAMGRSIPRCILLLISSGNSNLNDRSE